jgi:hypothetical protein
MLLHLVVVEVGCCPRVCSLTGNFGRMGPVLPIARKGLPALESSLYFVDPKSTFGMVVQAMAILLRMCADSDLTLK